MPSLRELQLGFARAVFGSAAAHDTPQLRAGTLPAEDRLGIYRTSVFLNYTRALGATYAAVQALIGPGCFSQLAAAFVRAAPSRSGDLNRYGAGFAGFLQTAPVVADLPYLPDVARLEWCMDEAFHEADQPALDLGRLAAVPAHRVGQLRFALDPSVRLLRSPYPVRRIRELALADAPGDEPVGIDDGEDCLLVLREGFVVMVHALAMADFAFVSGLARGCDFESAYGEALAVDPTFDPAPVLQRHVLLGTIVDFSLA